MLKPTMQLNRLGISICGIMGLVMLLTGCASQRTVVIDSQSSLVQLGPDVRGHVYLKVNGKWQLSSDKVKLPEGWWAGPFNGTGN